MQKTKYLPVNLRFFNETSGAATQGADTGAAQADPAQNQEGQTQEQAVKTFTEAEVQAETDRKVTKAVETALKNYQEKVLPDLLTKAKTEAEQLAKMTAEQKADHERSQAAAALATEKEALDKRAQEITKHELKIEAHKTLVEKKLPVELLDTLQYTDADACNASIVAVETAFKLAVEKEVNERFKGNPPPKGGGTVNERDAILKATQLAMGIR